MDATLGASGRRSNTHHGPTVLRRGNKCGEERQTALAATVAGADGPPRRPMRRHSCEAACVDRREFEDCAAKWPDRWLRGGQFPLFIDSIRITFLITIAPFFMETLRCENAPGLTDIRAVQRLPGGSGQGMPSHADAWCVIRQSEHGQHSLPQHPRVDASESNAKRQLAARFPGPGSHAAKAEALPLSRADDADEYVRRRALLAMNLVHAEARAERAWRASRMPWHIRRASRRPVSAQNRRSDHG